MEQDRVGFASEKRADNDNRKQKTSEPAPRVEQAKPKQESLGQRWSAVPVTKTTVFWACLASILLTMLLGFTWGGWVRSSTAQRAADLAARDAIVNRLATICVSQFNQDPAKDQKLPELQATSSFQRGGYVTEQGWATMPGEEATDRRVADACATQLLQTTQ
jgi:hypothetical protein